MSEKLIAHFQRQINEVQVDLDSFAKDFALEPALALSNSTKAFARAAELHALKQLMFPLRAGTSVEDIKHFLIERVLNLSTTKNDSTTPGGLVRKYELDAYAGILRELQAMR